MGILTIPGTGSGDSVPISRGDGGVLIATDAPASAIPSVTAKAFTPNGEQSFNVTPGAAVVDIAGASLTPTKTGIILITATVSVVASAPDTPALALFGLTPLVSVTGGTPVGTGVTQHPSATSPAAGATPINAGGQATAGGSNLSTCTVSGVFQGTVGVPLGILLTGLSTTGGATTWTVGYALSAIEV